MSELFDSAIVEKRNVLNELRSNNMTVQELRFFCIYLSKINPWDKATRVVKFPLEDFQRIMGFGRLNIKQLKHSTDSLLTQLVHIPDESGRGMRVFQLFKESHIFPDDDGNWFVEIDAHDRALPLMFDFQERYFKYELWNALRLRSSNQVRMYEILKQYEGLGKRELTVKALRELLGIAEDEYDRWSNFKIKVLDACQKALQENTDICYTYERGKTGRGGKWLTVVFHIEKNANHTDQISLEEFIAMQPTGALPAPMDECGLIEDHIDYYGSEELATLASGVQYEFTREQMWELRTLLPDIDIPPDRNFDGAQGILWGRVNYLAQLYAKLNRVCEEKKDTKTPIKNRFAYFKAMVDKDRSQD